MGLNYDLTPTIFIIITALITIISYVFMRYYLKKNYTFMFITMVVCYIMLIIKYMFFPISILTEEVKSLFWASLEGDSSFFQLNIVDSLTYIYNTLINDPISIIKYIIIMIPLGMLIHFVFSKQSFIKQILIGLGIIIGIESVQIIINYIIHYRQFVFDLSDIIICMTGFIIGIGIWAAIKRIPYIYHWINNNFIHIEKRQEQ